MAHRLIVAMVFFLTAVAGNADEHKVALNENGLHIQDWFYDSDRNLSVDLQTASDQGKDLLILYEQQGCIYCVELHEKNFTRSEITDLIKEGFLVVQLDLQGKRGVVDFDGTAMSEADLARKWGVNFTPTTMVFSGDNADEVTWQDAETFRLPGYLPPFYYFSALNYFSSGAFESMNFQPYLRAAVARLAEDGLDPGIW